MIQIVRLTQLEADIVKRQCIKVPCACKLVGGKVQYTGTDNSNDVPITVKKAFIDSSLKSYLIPGWTPESFVSGVAQSSGYTITIQSSPDAGELLKAMTGNDPKTPVLFGLGANTLDHAELDAGDFVYVEVPLTQEAINKTFIIDLEFEI